MYDIDLLIEKNNKFYNKLKEDEHGRYKSFEYCLKVFNEAHNQNDVDDNYLDYLSLQLAFYLASWGMYRGSSFLLQRDYKIHIPVIKLLLNNKYNVLWYITVNDLKKEENLDLLFELVKCIKEYYNEIRNKVLDNTPDKDISDTLVTKILMGTLGCVPAYDRYFIAGIKYTNVSTGIFNRNSILKLIDFYNDNLEKLENKRENMMINNLQYPQMKLIDMMFWQIGFDLDNENSVIFNK